MGYPLLTISIPTFNRSDNLRYLVQKLLPHLSDDLSLLIVDNNSDDDTSNYCRELKNSSKHVRYIKNKVNLGGAVNMLRCIEASNAKYTWLLGDDDDLDALLLLQLLDVLSESTCESFHVIPSSRKSHNISKFVFDNASEIIDKFYDITVFHLMSSNIYYTSMAKRFLRDAYRMVHLQHPFSVLHVRILENGGRLEILTLPILMDEQLLNKRWSKFSAHVDAIETSYLLFGSGVLSEEYNKRYRALLINALFSQFSKKDEGFNKYEISRLYALFGLSKLPFLAVLYFLSTIVRFKLSHHVIVYFVIKIFQVKYGVNAISRLKDTFSISDRSCVKLEMRRRIASKKEEFFTN
jgi:glycosyltransferase involved in cell wall biosynthesis